VAENETVAKFHETLKKLMQERGVSASVVCQATGIPKSTLSEWLGGRKPQLDDGIVRLARFFGVSVEHFVTGREPEETIIRDFIDQAEEGFVELHSGVYRLRVEKMLSGSRAKKGK
jgi:transcriptional regulator with XRE-family HTH domain